MFERYAVFYTPNDALASWGATWLGWDSRKGRYTAQADVADLNVTSLTAIPRKYGLHGTLKAPFHLDASTDLVGLQQGAADFAQSHTPFGIGEMELSDDNGFIALRPQGDLTPLRDFAAAIVRAFDPFSATLSETDIARRRQSPLTPRQDQQMLVWGYPFVFEDFHFHLTLSGPVNESMAQKVIKALKPQLVGLVDAPFVIDTITLMGQDSNGKFHQIHRYALTG